MTASKESEACLFYKVSRLTEDSGIASDLSAIDLESEDDEEHGGCPVHDHAGQGGAQDADQFLCSLPQEIWIKIFAEFSPYELCEIGLTSKGFLNLTRDPSLWAELCLVGDAETSIVVHLISRCSQLNKIRYK